VADKIAMITGATSGIGAAFARYFAGEGYDLIITGHPDDINCLDIDSLVRKCNVKVDLIYANLADEIDVEKIENIINKSSEIEVLVNNAGFVFFKHFWQKSPKELESMIKVHNVAPVRFIRAVLPNMVLKGKGTIIALSSLSSFMPIPHDSMYSATKLFLNSFLESLHISFRDEGIKVQLLCPGFVNSNFHARAGVKKSELRKNLILTWMDPEKVVEISVRNLRKKNKVIVIPGFRNRLIKFVMTKIPRPLYYRLAAKYLQ
jgi:uncharacterized protein